MVHGLAPEVADQIPDAEPDPVKDRQYDEDEDDQQGRGVDAQENPFTGCNPA
jgi:hypothetical protein